MGVQGCMMTTQPHLLTPKSRPIYHKEVAIPLLLLEVTTEALLMVVHPGQVLLLFPHLLPMSPGAIELAMGVGDRQRAAMTMAGSVHL